MTRSVTAHCLQVWKQRPSCRPLTSSSSAGSGQDPGQRSFQYPRSPQRRWPKLGGRREETPQPFSPSSHWSSAQQVGPARKSKSYNLWGQPPGHRAWHRRWNSWRGGQRITSTEWKKITFLVIISYQLDVRHMGLSSSPSVLYQYYYTSELSFISCLSLVKMFILIAYE